MGYFYDIIFINMILFILQKLKKCLFNHLVFESKKSAPISKGGNFVCLLVYFWGGLNRLIFVYVGEIHFFPACLAFV